MRFGILGPVEVLDDDGSRLQLGGRRPLAVLAILLLHAGEVVSVDGLIEELWGERAPRTAAKTIQVYVSRLRKALGEGVLVTQAHGYALRVDRAEIDRDRFERIVAHAREALQAGDAASAAGRLRDALGLWRGPPLADFAYEAFAQSEIGRLEEARLCALEDRIEADLGCGRHATVIAELEVLVREHPLRERLRAQLMLALYRAGRSPEALESFTAARQALVQQLGIEPGRQLRELQQAILEQDPALDPPAAAASSEGGRQHGASNLPPQPGRLIGRRREVSEICALLIAREQSLVTVLGIGGSGKTRLAVAIGGELRGWASGGVFLVRLADTRDRASVLPRIAEAVGLTGASEESLPDALARRLGERRTVLILDNLEQLLHAGPLIADLAAQAPELRALATSQLPLRLSCERVFPLGPLDREDAVALFVERARTHDAGFELTEGDPQDLVRICELLDDMPVAIELAAARVRSLGPRALLERLEHPLSLLTRGNRDVPDRQQSLRATIDWTFDLLSSAQQWLFARLGVCAGPVPLSAVEAIAGAGVETPEFRSWWAHGSLDSPVAVGDWRVLGARAVCPRVRGAGGGPGRRPGRALRRGPGW